LRLAYPDGLREFYRFIYPLGPFEGFYRVAQSFYHSGFFAEALKAFLTAEGEYREALTLYAKLGTSSTDGTRQEGAVSPLAEDEYARDPRLTLRSIRAKVGRIRKRQSASADAPGSGAGEVEDESVPPEPEAAEAATGS